MNFKTYLGDSVYAAIEDGMIRLTTENGEGPSNIIFLEPEVFKELLRWHKDTTNRILQDVRRSLEP